MYKRQGRLVALAAVGRGCQVRAVSFEYDVVQFHSTHRIGQLALPESHHAADSEGEIAAGFQFPVGDGILRKGVEHALSILQWRTMKLIYC